MAIELRNDVNGETLAKAYRFAGKLKGKVDKQRYNREMRLREQAQLANLVTQGTELNDRRAQNAAQNQMEQQRIDISRENSAAQIENTRILREQQQQKLDADLRQYDEGSPYDLYQERQAGRQLERQIQYDEARQDNILRQKNPNVWAQQQRAKLETARQQVMLNPQFNAAQKAQALQRIDMELAGLPEPEKEPTPLEEFQASTFVDPETGKRLQRVVRNGNTSYEPVYDDKETKAVDNRKRYDYAMKDAEAEVTADFEAQRDRQIGEIQAQIAQMDSGDVTPPSVQRKIGKLNADIRRLESLRPDRLLIEQRAEQILAEDQEFYDKMDAQNNGQVAQRPGMTPPFVAAPRNQAEYDQVQPGNPYLSADAYGLPLIKGKEGEGYQLMPGKTAVPAAGAGAWEQEMERVRQSFPNNPAVKQAADVMELLMTTRGNVQNMSPEEQKAYMRAKQVLQKTGL